MEFYMGNIFMSKIYYRSITYRESYKKSSKRRNEKLQLSRNYSRALKKGNRVRAIKYKREIDNLQNEAEKESKILVYVR